MAAALVSWEALMSLGRNPNSKQGQTQENKHSKPWKILLLGENVSSKTEGF